MTQFQTANVTPLSRHKRAYTNQLREASDFWSGRFNVSQPHDKTAQRITIHGKSSFIAA